MSIPANINPFLLAAAAVASPVQIERSLRFNSSDSAYLSRTPASAGNRKTWTWAGWVKRSALTGADQFLYLCSTANTSPTTSWIGFNSSEKLTFGTSGYSKLITTQVFRDVSAWYHILLSVDTTQATAANRYKFYVNGVEVSAYDTASYVTQNTDTEINAASEHRIGRDFGSFTTYSSGYLTECYLIDGQALTPSSFTEVSATTGQLIPKAYTGTYGTNGFKLTFSDNSNTTATTLGKDTSGNGNNWTPTNFAINTSTLNYSSYWVAGGNNNAPIGPNNAFDGSTSTYFRTNGSSNTQTWTPPSSIAYTSLRVYVYNIVGSSTNVLFVNGVAQTTPTSTGWFTPSGVSSPLTSIEIRETASTALGIAAVEINSGILLDRSWPGNDSLVDTPTSYGTDTGVGNEVRGNYCTLNPLDKGGGASAVNGNLDLSLSSPGSIRSTFGLSSGKWYWETTLGASSFTAGITKAGTALSAYLGSQANEWSYGQDGRKYTGASGSSYGATFTTGDVIGVAFDADNGTLTFYKNGSSQGTAFTGLTSGPYFPAVGDNSATSGHACNFGQRAFAYTAPSGFKALCDTNLPAPVVAKPSTVMDVKLYTGNGSTQTISGLGFSPDLVWIKERSSAENHQLQDIVRGATNRLFSNLTAAESADAGSLTSFNSDGFSLGNAGNYNGLNDTYVAWCWDAGSSTVSNPDGSITSSVRANPSSGFSIVGYTGTGSSGSLGHGLNVKPQLIIVKSRTQARDWLVYHSSYGATQYMTLNGTGAAAATTSAWNNTEPTSTVFTIGNAAEINTNGSTNIAYCFAPVVGYSSFGSYTGNGSTDGPFVYTGFRPKFIIVKSSSFAEYWEMYDASRDTYNVASKELFANASNAETTYAAFDFLSNGFKMRNTGTGANSSGQTYIYCAWAESPFAYARAR